MRISRERYAALYGPTVGDQIRLADTDLWIEVERDDCAGGDEAVFGGGKTIRESMLQGTTTRAEGAPDLVITNAVVLDHWGIVKCDVGIRDGRIVALGKAGNPDIADGVDPALRIGPSTEILAGEGRILTAGGIDCHVHFICPQIVDEALASGITTLIGGGTGPAEGTKATTCTPGEHALAAMLGAMDESPVNVLLLGKGNTVSAEALHEQVRAGAGGFKLHEDWGSTPAAIDACLRVGDETGVQVAIHTDTLNETGFLESTVEAIGGRTIHAYHTEGAGGGHAPDIIRIASFPNVLPSSTNPTRPHTVNTVAEHLDMLMVCHHLNPRVPEDLAFAESRIRATTIAAEDVLHDLGAISMIGSDSQAMGRAGETILRTWQTAHAMKARLGRPEGGLRRQRARPPLRRQVHDLPGRRARARRRGRLGRGREARRSRALGPALLRRPAARGRQGRRDRLGADRRRERLDPDAAAGVRPADVRRLGPGGRRGLARVRRARRLRLAGSPSGSGCGARLAAVGEHPPRSARPTCPRTRRCRTSASSRTPSGSGSTARRSSRAPRSSCPWPSDTSSSDVASLPLLLLTDSRFPAGGYAHSGGLEAAVEDGLGVDGVAGFLAGRLYGVAGPEAHLAAAAARAARRSTSCSRSTSRRPRGARARRSGRPRPGSARSCLRTAATVWPDAARIARYRAASSTTPRPVAFGLVAAVAGLDALRDGVRLPVRGRRVDHDRSRAAAPGRRRRRRPHARRGGAGDRAARRGGRDRASRLPGGFAPALELGSLAHAAREGRLFAS